MPAKRAAAAVGLARTLGRAKHAIKVPSRKSLTSGPTSEPVLALLSTLEHPHKAGILSLREWILELDARIREEVKWNAPSFMLEDHFATFRLHPAKNIQLILHTGAKAKSNTKKFVVEDPAGLLAWPATDRCVLTLASEAELQANREAVLRIIRQWIAQL